MIREVLSFETLPPGQKGSRRAVVRWSDGRVGDALRWWDDEILICDGDLVGKSASQLRALHFHRDREFLQSPHPESSQGRDGGLRVTSRA